MERITKLLEAPEILSNNRRMSMSDEVDEEAIDEDALAAERESSVAAEDDNPGADTVEPAGTRILDQN